MDNQVDREAMQMAEQKMPKTIQIRSTAEMSAWLTDYCKTCMPIIPALCQTKRE